LARPSSFALWTIKILIEGAEDFYAPFEMVHFVNFFKKKRPKMFSGSRKI